MKLKIIPTLYYFLIFLVVLDASINATTFKGSTLNYLHYACLLLSIILILILASIKSYTPKMLFVTICLFVYGVLSYFISGNTDLFFTLIVVVLADKIKIDKLLKTIFGVRLGVFLITLVSSLVGLLPIGIFFAPSGEKGVILGYSHANTFAATVGILLLLYLAIYRKRYTKTSLIFVFLITIFTYWISRARIFLLLMLFTVFGLLLAQEKWIKKIKNIFKSLLFGICFVNVSLIWMRATKIGWAIVDKIDYIFNGRMLLSAITLSYYPITVFGQRADLNQIKQLLNYYALDNGYVYITVFYGIIGILLFCTIMQLAMQNAINESDTVLCIITTVFMVWMMYEGMMASVGSNFMLLFAFSELSEKRLRS